MKATKKIVGAACALVAAIALSAGSTFAWFTSNNQVTISQISATVTTGGGDLQIALVDTSGTNAVVGAYSHKIDAPKFEYVKTPASDPDPAVMEDGKLLAVTTTNGLTFFTEGGVDEDEKHDGRPKEAPAEGNEVDTYGTVKYDTDEDNTTKKATAMKDYYSFTFSLRSTTDMKIYFTHDSEIKSTKPATTPNSSKINAFETSTAATDDASEYGKKLTLNSPIETDAMYAARVNFLPWPEHNGTGNPTKPTATNTKTLGNLRDNKVYVWAPYESVDGTTKGSAAGFWKGNLAADYIRFVTTGKLTLPDYGVGKDPAKDTVSKRAAAYLYPKYTSGEGTEWVNISDMICGVTSEVEDPTGKTQFLHIKAGYNNIVTLNLWLEGQDGDCCNNIFAHTITVNIGFYGVEAAVGA